MKNTLVPFAHNFLATLAGRNKRWMTRAEIEEHAQSGKPFSAHVVLTDDIHIFETPLQDIDFGFGTTLDVSNVDFHCKNITVGALVARDTRTTDHGKNGLDGIGESTRIRESHINVVYLRNRLWMEIYDMKHVDTITADNFWSDIYIGRNKGLKVVHADIEGNDEHNHPTLSIVENPDLETVTLGERGTFGLKLDGNPLLKNLEIPNLKKTKFAFLRNNPALMYKGSVIQVDEKHDDLPSLITDGEHFVLRSDKYAGANIYAAGQHRLYDGFAGNKNDFVSYIMRHKDKELPDIIRRYLGNASPL